MPYEKRFNGTRCVRIDWVWDSGDPTLGLYVAKDALIKLAKECSEDAHLGVYAAQCMVSQIIRELQCKSSDT